LNKPHVSNPYTYQGFFRTRKFFTILRNRDHRVPLVTFARYGEQYLGKNHRWSNDETKLAILENIDMS
jgi:hypothetical protein